MKMPFPITRGFLAIFVVVMLVVACGGPKKEAALSVGSKVLALGDSLTAPHGIKPGEDWPTLLAQKTGWIVVNAGVSGTTSAQALERLPGDVGESIAGYCADRRTVHEDIGYMVPGGGSDGEGLARAIVHRDVPGRGYRSIGPGAGGNGEGVDGEAG